MQKNQPRVAKYRLDTGYLNNFKILRMLSLNRYSLYIEYSVVYRSMCKSILSNTTTFITCTQFLYHI